MIKKATTRTIKMLTIGTIILALGMISPFAYRTALRQYVSAKSVRILAFDKGMAIGGGTGFYVKAKSGQTYIMTNRHVCSINKKLELKIELKNKNFVKAEIIEISKTSDLCLIKSPDSTEGLALADSIDAGDSISYAGYPRLQPLTMANGEAVGYSVISVFVGFIGKDLSQKECQKNKDMHIENMMLPKYTASEKISQFEDFSLSPTKVCLQTGNALVTTAMIYPGASGSPIVNYLGKLVGAVYAGPQGGGWGWGVPLTAIKEFLLGR